MLVGVRAVYKEGQRTWMRAKGGKGPVAWAAMAGWGGYPGVGEQWGAMMLRGGGGGRTGSSHEATEATQSCLTLSPAWAGRCGVGRVVDPWLCCVFRVLATMVGPVGGRTHRTWI